MDYLKAACKRLNVDLKRVIKHREVDGEFVVIVDNGIDGCPKYMVPLTDLTINLEAGVHVVEETDIPEGMNVAGPEVESVTVSVEEEEPELPEPEATDSARDLAFEHGIDIRTVQGSGKGGKVIKRDVEALL